MGEVVTMTGEQATTASRSRGPAVNRVELLGRLVADPELKFTPEGRPIAELRMVTHERQEPEFHELVSYGRLAEVVAEYVKKGSMVLAEGRLHSQAWTASDGSARRRTVVIAESVQFLTRKAEQ